MNVFEILFAFCALYCGTASAAPVKRIDQRQDGDLNIQAHLDKIVLLIVPNKNINILDIKGQGPFEHYEDLLPLLGKENTVGGGGDNLKYGKLSPDDVKLKTFVMPAAAAAAAAAIIESKEDKKETTAFLKLEPSSPLPSPPIAASPTPKIEPKEPKESKKPDVRETTPKKIDAELKMVSETNNGAAQQQQKKMSPKSDSRTYQTLHSGNNRERVIAVSSQELEQRKGSTDLPTTKIEKL